MYGQAVSSPSALVGHQFIFSKKYTGFRVSRGSVLLEHPDPGCGRCLLAIIADGGRAIVVIYREAAEINLFLIYFITL